MCVNKVHITVGYHEVMSPGGGVGVEEAIQWYVVCRSPWVTTVHNVVNIAQSINNILKVHEHKHISAHTEI